MWNLNGKMNNVTEEGVLWYPIGAADFADFLHAYSMRTWFYFGSRISFEMLGLTSLEGSNFLSF
jgi:hypothetical protein